MKSLISEFSYGFALTHEFVLSLGSLTAAPIFPSLIEEGREGGGYDVKLEAPGLPLFLQFKRTDCLSRRSAREIRAGAPLETPYYRMEITGKDDSEQHRMLIDLDLAPNLVFYAAPMFHRKEEFDAAFLGGTVRQQSFFVPPRAIGNFPDGKAHHVSFDGNNYVVMSEPRIIEGYGVSELEAMLKERLAADGRPLRETVDEAIEEAQSARTRSRRRIQVSESTEKEGDVLADQTDGETRSASELFRQRQERIIPPAPEPVVKADPDRDMLRRLADIGLREFNAQLYIVQSKS
ncbi:MAG: hypothetical protein JWM65_1291 [Sphingomonas bacterium]|nr:hypothetical protein [Sphingomonas bacterium]